MAEERVLEMTVIGASNLKDVNILSKMETFAIVRFAPYVEYTTDVDPKGGINPHWNEKFGFLVPEHVLQRGDSKIKVEIYTYSTLGQKFVSEASIPVSDISTTSRLNQLQQRRYPLKTASGDFQGELHVGFTLQEKFVLSKSDETPHYPIMRPPNSKPFDGEFIPPYKPPHTQHDIDPFAPSLPSKSPKSQPSYDLDSSRTPMPYDFEHGKVPSTQTPYDSLPLKAPKNPTPYDFDRTPTPYDSLPLKAPKNPVAYDFDKTPTLYEVDPSLSYPTKPSKMQPTMNEYDTSHPYEQVTGPMSTTPYKRLSQPSTQAQGLYPGALPPYPSTPSSYPISQSSLPGTRPSYNINQNPYPSYPTQSQNDLTPYERYPNDNVSGYGAHPFSHVPPSNIFSTPIGKVLLSDLSKNTIASRNAW